MTTFDKYGLTYYSIMDAPDELLHKFFEAATREDSSTGYLGTTGTACTTMKTTKTSLDA